jgi:aspartate aminotransferase
MLNAIPGLNCLKPDGGFYLFPNCSAFIGRKTPEGASLEDDRAFVLHLLDAGGVAAVHGSAYGLPGYFRLTTWSSSAAAPPLRQPVGILPDDQAEL